MQFLLALGLLFAVRIKQLVCGEHMANIPPTYLLIRLEKATDLPQISAESASFAQYVFTINGLLINGLTRGTLVEASGARSSGKSSP